MSKEFLFADESGDPGVHGDPIYVLVVLHVDEAMLHPIREHLTAYRYYHGSRKEFKDSRWKTPSVLKLLGYLAEQTEDEQITTTANWLNKPTYRAGRGPHLSGPGETVRFRNYQFRRVLERHIGRRPWGAETDLVIDRWVMSLAERRNLEDYLRDNFTLRPELYAVTLVDSAYSDMIQLVDMYARLANRVLKGRASPEEKRLLPQLMALQEVQGGLY